ncbi:hypothetical protein AB0G57_42160, partial [Streptomyces lavendulae]
MSGWCREQSRRGRRLPLIRAADATCALLADGHPAVLAGAEGEAFTPALQREYPSLLAVLLAGRTDHHIIALPGPEGTPGWAAVEPHLTHDPHTLEHLRTQITTRAQEGVRAGRNWRECGRRADRLGVEGPSAQAVAWGLDRSGPGVLGPEARHGTHLRFGTRLSGGKTPATEKPGAAQSRHRHVQVVGRPRVPGAPAAS